MKRKEASNERSTREGRLNVPVKCGSRGGLQLLGLLSENPKGRRERAEFVWEIPQVPEIRKHQPIL